MFNNQRICMPFVRILAILFTIMWSGSILFGQTRTVTGQVIDQATGEPVIGANVLVKGTTTGTITDLDGNFSISGVTDKSVLHVSFVGYTAEDVPVRPARRSGGGRLRCAEETRPNRRHLKRQGR